MQKEMPGPHYPGKYLHGKKNYAYHLSGEMVEVFELQGAIIRSKDRKYKWLPNKEQSRILRMTLSEFKQFVNDINTQSIRDSLERQDT